MFLSCAVEDLWLQVMGDELLEILEGQKRLDQQFQQMTSPADRGSLREAARGMSTATEGELIIYPHFSSFHPTLHGILILKCSLSPIVMFPIGSYVQCMNYTV